jgi:hypothetical protein
MNGTQISGKKLVWVGGLVLLAVAASTRIFAVFYLHDMSLLRSPAPPAATTRP